MIAAWPLQWPTGWPRTAPHSRKDATFSRSDTEYRDGTRFTRKRDLTVTDGVERVLTTLARMGIDRQDVVVSTNVRTRLDGLPRSGEPKPSDPGAAVYWETRKQDRRVMAIDRYSEVADNLAAIALTLEAMRAIERHGGAQILDRAFTGFTQLAAPVATRHWRDVLGVGNVVISADELELAYKRARSAAHPDNDGKAGEFDAVQRAYEDGCAELGFAP